MGGLCYTGSAKSKPVLTINYYSAEIQKNYFCNLPNTDALVNATKRLEYEQPSILNEVIQASDEEEVIDEYL